MRRKECYIIHSAIDQVLHDPEIAAFFEQDKARLEQAFYDELVRAKRQGEFSNRHDDLLAMARFFYHTRYSLTQAAKFSPDPQVLKQIADVTLSS